MWSTTSTSGSVIVYARCDFKQWKRGTTTFRAARAYGLSVDAAVMVASHNRRWWHFARLATHLILPTREIDALGVPRLGR
jgi:hypothetical protein